ncbi:hypothetical protein HK104_002045 [Borealophlyctis nickersoniae]|nr:hypothetical protein HK104_002045 [Borealophlyctis nickersoniae]
MYPLRKSKSMDMARGVSLYGILNGETTPPYALRDFEAFCRAEHAAENLDFIHAALQYRCMAVNIYAKYCPLQESQPAGRKSGWTAVGGNHHGSGNMLTDIERDTLKKQLDDIVGMYLVGRAYRELNISDRIRKGVLEEIEHQNYHPAIFEPAVQKAPVI